MGTAKAKAIEWIQALPDDCTLADIRYHLHFQQKLEEGLLAIEEGRVIPPVEVEGRFAQWAGSHVRRQA